jgi:hypothetical protein
VAPVARQRGHGAAAPARVKVPGLKRPCLESGRAWASATRAEEARAILAMSRRGGRSKVYRELLRQCRDGVPLDGESRPALSSGAPEQDGSTVRGESPLMGGRVALLAERP